MLALGPCASAEQLRLAMASSLDYSGLGDEIVAGFAEASGCDVAALPASSSHGIELLTRKDVAAAISHNPEQERNWLRSDGGRKRIGILVSEFILAGTKQDPAGVAGMGISEAFKKIREKEAVFLSRDDRSGTHAMEMKIWEEAGGAPGKQASWYRRAARQMGAALQIADQLGAYTLSERAALLTFEEMEGGLAMLARDNPGRSNPYSLLLPADPQTCALQLADWFAGTAAAKLINRFAIGGENPFTAAPLSR